MFLGFGQIRRGSCRNVQLLILQMRKKFLFLSSDVLVLPSFHLPNTHTRACTHTHTETLHHSLVVFTFSCTPAGYRTGI